MDKAVVCYDSVLPKRPFYAHSTAPPGIPVASASR
jgi:hypothetical protein